MSYPRNAQPPFVFVFLILANVLLRASSDVTRCSTNTSNEIVPCRNPDSSPGTTAPVINLSIGVQICSDSGGKYVNNSMYETNLNNLLSTLSTNINQSGFYSASMGQNSDRAYAIVLCRGDTQLDTCRSCVQNATTGVLGLCPNYKEAILWAKLCMLRYSYKYILETLDTNHYTSMSKSNGNVTSPSDFKVDLMSFMEDLSLEASLNSRKVAAGDRLTSNNDQKIYALVQCTPDLSPTSCKTCLMAAAAVLHIANSASSLMPSCNTQYDTAPFFNQTRLSELDEQLPSSQGSTSERSPKPQPQPGVVGVPTRNTSLIIIIAVVSVAACLIIVFFVGFLIRKRMNKTRKEETKDEAVGDLDRGAATKYLSVDLMDHNKQEGGGSILVVHDDEAVGDLDRGAATKYLSVDLMDHNKQEGGGSILVVNDGLGEALVAPKMVPPVDITTFESLLYDFDVIRVATDDFSEANKLGHGGFGAVYKGKLPSGQEIAVKRLSRISRQGDPEFKNEVILLAKLQHRNLVRLLGFAFEGEERLLVYEYVQNSSLDKFLFEPTNRSNLDWDTRDKIIRGIAKGILYLHEDSLLKIIHRDLKASNVLLDGEMNPKIADFGVAKLFESDETHCSTIRTVGTHGYIAPEYKLHGHFSVKSDVYSFGVLLLEAISGQKNKCFRPGGIEQNLTSKAWQNWRNGAAANLVDPVLRDGSRSIRQDKILRCIQIGLLCVQQNAAKRPTTAEVVKMLDGYPINLPAPLEPGFYMCNKNDVETPSCRIL